MWRLSISLRGLNFYSNVARVSREQIHRGTYFHVGIGILRFFAPLPPACTRFVIEHPQPRLASKHFIFAIKPAALYTCELSKREIILLAVPFSTSVSGRVARALFAWKICRRMILQPPPPPPEQNTLHPFVLQRATDGEFIRQLG